MSLPSELSAEYLNGQFLPIYVSGIWERGGDKCHDNKRDQFTRLDVLPYVRLGVNHTHVGLLCPAVDEYPVVLVQKCMSCVILKGTSEKSLRDRRDWPTGDCWPVAALFAKGIVNS